METEKYISVSELNLYIKSYLENNYFLQDVYVKGEISNFKHHQSGTLYFAIKDENACINVVMFASYASRLKVTLKDGDLVLIHGRISVYEARGTYQIMANEVIFDSKGMLLVAYEELKAKLKDEGLFDISHKKPLPKYPTNIGIITAPYGAAIQDMHKTIKSRWPLASIIVFPSLVQGDGAAKDIVKNIKLADDYNLDVIICGRGGGSIEDLWPFNEEIVARAFFECNTPLISAVSHEIDTVITDYVADARGLTPTDGAIKATPNIKDEIENVYLLENNLVIHTNKYLSMLRQELDNLTNSYVLKNPTKIYENIRLKVDYLESSLQSLFVKMSHDEKLNLVNLTNNLVNGMNNYLINLKNKMMIKENALDNLSPLKVLNRGYSVASSKDKIIKSIDDVKENDLISLQLKDGKIKAKVEEKEKN